MKEFNWVAACGFAFWTLLVFLLGYMVGMS